MMASAASASGEGDAAPAAGGGRGSRLLAALIRPPAALAAVVLASSAVRIAYFLQLTAGPCAWQHRWPETDMHFFDRWARLIAGGDGLTNRALHPLLGWHQGIAAAYFKENPGAEEAIARGQEPGDPRQPWQVLWDRWYLGKTFHQEPLYPYLVALTYKLFGPDVRWVFAWQLAGGVLTNVLIYLVARRHFGDAAAAIAGALAVLSSPLLYYELLLLRESLIVLAGIALVLCVDRIAGHGRRRDWILAGLAFGLALLLKTTFALYLVAVLGWLAWVQRRELTLWLRGAALLLAATAVPLAPAVARNAAVGAPPFSLTSVGALAFLFANTPDYDPDESFHVSPVHSHRILARSDGRFLPTVIETLKTHPGIGSYLKQVWGKWASLWHWYEKPNNSNFYYYRLEAPVLNLPVTFFILAPLSILGLALAAPRFACHGSLYLLVLTTMAQMLAFYVISRFRVPLHAALIPFAAFAVTRVARWAAGGQWLRFAAAAAVVIAISLWTRRSLPPERPLIRVADYSVPFQHYYGQTIEEAKSRGDWNRVAALASRALRLEPDFVRAIGTGRPPGSKPQAQLAHLFAITRGMRADALARLGRAAEAADEERRARELRDIALEALKKTP